MNYVARQGSGQEEAVVAMTGREAEEEVRLQYPRPEGEIAPLLA
jgi:hypothetical protein